MPTALRGHVGFSRRTGSLIARTSDRGPPREPSQNVQAIQRAGPRPRPDVLVLSTTGLLEQGPESAMAGRRPRPCPDATSISRLGLRHHAGARPRPVVADRAGVRDRRRPQLDQAVGGEARPRVRPRLRAGIPPAHGRSPTQRRRSLSVLATGRRLRSERVRTGHGGPPDRVHPQQSRAAGLVRAARRLAVVECGRVCRHGRWSTSYRSGIGARGSSWTDDVPGWHAHGFAWAWGLGWKKVVGVRWTWTMPTQSRGHATPENSGSSPARGVVFGKCRGGMPTALRGHGLRGGRRLLE